MRKTNADEESNAPRAVGNLARAKLPRSDEATFVPSHGNGRLLPPIKPGEARNPSGRPRGFKEIRALARREAPDALMALIGVYKRPDGLLDRSADAKAVIAAALGVLKWAFGDAPPYDAHEDKPPIRMNLDGLSLEDRKQMILLLDRVKRVAPDSEHDVGPVFDASRFATKPTVIDGGRMSEPTAPGSVSSTQRRKRGRPRKMEEEAQPTPRKRGRPLGSKTRKGKARVRKAPNLHAQVTPIDQASQLLNEGTPAPRSSAGLQTL